MEIRKSDIVLSLAGRDSGEYFLVLDTEDNYAFCADGRGRRVEKPKHKKLRHLRYVCRGTGNAAEKLREGLEVTNSEIRRTLSVSTKVLNEANREVC